jgi:hypothetical protein
MTMELLYTAMALAGIVAVLCTVGVWLMPVRWLVARIRKRFRRTAFEEFRAKHSVSKARRFRYWVGMVFLAVPLAAFLLLVLVIFLLVHVFAMAVTAADLNACGQGLGVFLCIWIGGCFLALPLSYVYEFYFIDARRRIFSPQYLELFLLNLAFPVVFCVMFGVLRMFGGLDFIERRISSPPIPDPVVAVTEKSPCSAKLDALGLYRTSFKKDEHGRMTIDGLGYPLLWADMYIQGITLATLDPFECSLTDIRSNSGHVAMSVLVWFFRLYVSLFAVGVYALPVQELLAWLKRRRKKA